MPDKPEQKPTEPDERRGLTVPPPPKKPEDKPTPSPPKKDT
jgi:hypothetical protein